MNLQLAQHVNDAITSRHSVRAFLSRTVDPQIIKDILTVASRAPSGKPFPEGAQKNGYRRVYGQINSFNSNRPLARISLKVSFYILIFRYLNFYSAIVC